MKILKYKKGKRNEYQILTDEKEYTLYDDKNKQVMTARGEEIEDVSKEEKQKISEYYRKEFI